MNLSKLHFIMLPRFSPCYNIIKIVHSSYITFDFVITKLKYGKAQFSGVEQVSESYKQDRNNT